VERPRLVDLPMFWFVVQLIEFLILVRLLSSWVPVTWSNAARATLWIATGLVFCVVNYLLIRRVRARYGSSDDT
jgi:hypothetical protein